MGLIKLLFTSRATLVRAYALARDARVPVHLKLLALLGGVLIVSPLNVLEFIPIVGIVDDVVLFGFLLSWFVRVAERSLIEEARPGAGTIAGTAIATQPGGPR
ncbi:MAG: hypothetical protein NVS3B7_02830 [Candidatus Elarobacter sp.]